MELSSMKKLPPSKCLEVPLVKKIRRLYHIKSLPAYTHDITRKESHSKLEVHPKEEP